MAGYLKLFRSQQVRIGLYEIQGRRPTQEDYLSAAVTEVKDLPLLSLQEQKEVFTKSFAQLQKQYGQVKNTGSTCCAVTAWVDLDTNVLQVITASVGDSSAYLIIIDEALESLVTAKRLNPLHNPDAKINLDEFYRVAAIDMPSQYENHGPLRLNGSLAVTRGFGDRYYERFGLLHTPDIIQTHKTLSPTQKAFIVLACDGLTEERVVINQRGQHVQKAALSIDGIANIVMTMQKKRPVDQIAEHLTDSAYVNGSHDNISVAVFAVGKKPASAVVCDGHNGVISKDIGENFYPILRSTIDERLKLNEKPRLVAEIVDQTQKMLELLTIQLITEMVKSKSLSARFMKKNNIDLGLNQSLSKLITANYKDKLPAFIHHYKKSAALHSVGTGRLTRLINQYSKTQLLIKTLLQFPPTQALDKAHDLFNDVKLRRQLSKNQPYWGWLLQKLEWTKGQRLVKFFDNKRKDLTNITEIELTRKSAAKKSS